MAEPRASMAIEQGLEMGRPSRANALVDREGGKITRVRVGGQAVHLADAFLHL